MNFSHIIKCLDENVKFRKTRHVITLTVFLEDPVGIRCHGRSLRFDSVIFYYGPKGHAILVNFVTSISTPYLEALDDFRDSHWAELLFCRCHVILGDSITVTPLLAISVTNTGRFAILEILLEISDTCRFF